MIKLGDVRFVTSFGLLATILLAVSIDCTGTSPGGDRGSSGQSSPGRIFSRHLVSWATGNAYKDLSRYLTRETHSNELVDNIRVAEQLAHPEVGRLLGSEVTKLVRALVSLVPLEKNMDQDKLESFCGAQNLSSLRALIEAMVRTYSAPTREPENKKRLNLLLIKCASDVRSYCFEYLKRRWLNYAMQNLDGFEQVHYDQLPTDKLFRQQLDSRTPHTVIKFVGHLGKMLLETSDEPVDKSSNVETKLAGSRLIEQRLHKPCSELIESDVGQHILAPAVDLVSIGLIVFDKFHVGELDERKHHIKSISLYLMCKQLLNQSRRNIKRFHWKLNKVLQADQRDSQRIRTH